MGAPEWCSRLTRPIRTRLKRERSSPVFMCTMLDSLVAPAHLLLMLLLLPLTPSLLLGSSYRVTAAFSANGSGLNGVGTGGVGQGGAAVSRGSSLFPSPLSVPDCISLKDGGKPSLVCSSGVTRLPLPGIRLSTNLSKLLIMSAQFGPGLGAVLTASNLTGLESLVLLKLADTNLERLERRTFFHLVELRTLDLSSNRIQQIAIGAFEGLRLERLILSKNEGIFLPVGTFRDAKVSRFL
ncbi:unnamed protein product [Protopolystoma xenopodis]|uniref:LRRNT domain-containing protein n=1 Tax=Protopolystoma xenopodis TaxID=117903 RepID=A0A3S5B7M6_9PLAT|nr:unnamed protein product [Protopolystoma xenopodis]